MSQPVFISYARRKSLAYAETLHRELGTELAFLDTSDIEQGDHLPDRLADALLAAKVVVVFVDEVYFQRWYCLWELRTALTPFLWLEADAGEAERKESLASIILALPPQGNALEELERLPPLLRRTNWPSASETGKLAGLVRTRVEAVRWTLGERLEVSGPGPAQVQMQLLEDAAHLPPMSLAGVKRLYPLERRPSLGRFFVGRANELWRLDFLLSTQGRSEAKGAAPIVTLEAMGGSGKTRLALEYVHRLGPRRFPGGIFWVDAGVGEDEREGQLHDILRMLRPHVPELAVFRQQRRDAAKELAEALHVVAARELMLYVVDNVPETGPGRAALPLRTWCPALGKVALLVTSRAAVALGESGAQRMPLGTLLPDAAVALLTTGVRDSFAERTDWYQIAEWVGHLPLALELLNRSLLAGGVGATELLAMAQRRGPIRELDKQMDALRREVSTEALRGVTEAFDISYERLAERERKTARLVARLAPVPIPMAVMEALGQEVFSGPIRVSLHSRHFVTPVAEGAIPFFGVMHRVLADFLFSKANTPVAELHQLCEALVAVMDLEKCRDPREWPLMNACFPHAEKIFGELLGTEPASPSQAQREVLLGLAMGTQLMARGLVVQANEIGRQVLQRARRVLGEEHPETLTAMGNLAVTCHVQGDLVEARKLEEHVLEVSRRVLGEEHPGTLRAIGNLALTCHAQGDLASARALGESALETAWRVLGEDHPNTLPIMSNLVMTRHAQGDLEGARELGERVLEATWRKQGRDHPDTLSVVSNLAMIHHGLGNLEEARALLERVLEVSLRILGEEHPNTLKVMGNLAMTLYSQEDSKGARALLERVLEVSGRILGEEHTITLTTMINLALICQTQGDLASARELGERVLEMSQRVLGAEHPETLTAMGNLALTCHMQGDFASARELGDRVLEMRRRILGEEHPETLTASGNLAVMRDEQGDMVGARELDEQLLKVIRRVLGEFHPNTLLVMRRLTMTRHAQEDLAGARELGERVLEVSQRVLGEEHPDTLAAKGNLAVMRYEQGDLEGARAQLKQVLEVSQRVLGEEHPDTLSALNNLARMSQVRRGLLPGIRKMQAWMRKMLQRLWSNP